MNEVIEPQGAIAGNCWTSRLRRMFGKATVALAALALVGGIAHAQNLPGGIYTTDKTGTKVNGNVFLDCEDVYLNGGPQNDQGNGLPDGQYYFQVTDPSGQVLLTTDPIVNRRVNVIGGRIYGSISDGDGVGRPNGDFNPANTSQGVKLAPFDESPNNGDVHKAWLTRISDYDPAKGRFGFIPSKSKTDNFKCVHDDGGPGDKIATVVVEKYRDRNGNGVRDDEETPLNGWEFKVVVKDANGDTILDTSVVSGATGTPGAGYAVATVIDPDGSTPFPLSVEVTEVAQAGWKQTEPASGGLTGTIEFKDGFAAFRFGNAKTLKLSGTKFYDKTPDGVFTIGDFGIAGFTINVSINGSLAESPVSGLLGAWTTGFEYVEGSTYSVSEAPVSAPWVQTGPTPSTYTGTLDGGDDEPYANGVSGLDFFNVKYGNGGGLTLGFWSNKNGASLLAADDFALLTSLNLRRANGIDREFTASNATNIKDFQSWLLNATATNMSYMLSAQLAAMTMNVYNGKVDGTWYIYAPGTTSANLLGYATVNAVMAEANTFLGANAVVVNAGPVRTLGEAIKNALDNANNNRNFVLPTP
ncbi:MAG: hypothetical protein ACKO5K_08270 [Armatimonadota bacterium]